jgi:hypothetical protein
MISRVSAIVRGGCRWHRLASLIFIFLLASLVAAQPARIPFQQGDNAFRFVLNLFKFEPLKDVNQLDENAEHSILIVFGDTQILDRLPAGGLENFLNKGGAVLVATDRDVNRKWQDSFETEFKEFYVHVPGALGYRNNPECPFVAPTDVEDPPIFRNLKEVATNRPIYFVNKSQNLKTLAVFGRGSWIEGPVPFLANYPFAAGGEIGNGRVLVLSDHSVFINAMMIPTDNDNFDFAYRCLDWLQESGKRTHVLFLNEAETVTNFDVPVTDLPPLPMDVLNQLIVKMEQEDLFNRMVLGEGDWRFRHILQVAIVVLTTALTGFGCYRFLLARHVVETKEPLFSAKVTQQTPALAVTTQRQLSMIKSDNFWEAAHHMARDWFLANMPDSLMALSSHGMARPGSSKGMEAVHAPHALRIASGRATRRAAIGRFSVDAGWWGRRSWERKLQLVWQIAVGPPLKLSAAEFARFVTQLDEIKAALAKGTLRLKPSAD